MATVVIVPGSWRQESLNLKLARAAAERMPAGSQAHVESIRDIPLYDGDIEAGSGAPAAVSRLKNAIAAADALLLVTPEYNNSMPGALKNAVDWLSRPPSDSARVFKDRAVGLMGATPGMGGTRMAQAAWLPVLRALGMQLWSGGSLFVSDAAKVFGADGRLADARIDELLTRFMQGFAAFAAQPRR